MTLDIEWVRDLAGHQSEGNYGKFGVVEYVDNSYACNLDDRKSITRYCFFLARVIVTWCSKRQYTLSTSIFEAKYMAISYRVREDVWI